MGINSPAPGTRPGWMGDPNDGGRLRYWDGHAWTDYHVHRPQVWANDHASTSRTAWWQTWWVIVPALFLCFPVGLIGLWKRPGSTTTTRAIMTVVTLVLFTGVFLIDEPTGEDDTVAADRSASTEDAPEPAAAESTPDPSPVVVPDLAGLTRSEARDRLDELGLVIGAITRLPSAEPRGTVIEQGESPDASLAPGSTVALVLAAPLPRVPNVVGALLSEARSVLRQAGFDLVVRTKRQTSGTDRSVLRQTPGRSVRAEPGSTVTLVVAEVVAPPPPEPVENCTDGYSPCLPPAPDYDCAGGSGDGPAYAQGPVTITGSDPYDLDDDGDGVACEG